MEHSLTTTLESDEICVTLAFHGDLTDAQAADFKKDLEDAGRAIATQSKKMGRKLLILLDMTGFSGNYAASTLSALVSFAEHNVDYVEKTASFGGSDKVKMAGEVAIVLSHRDNIKIFDAREDAVQWLKA